MHATRADDPTRLIRLLTLLFVVFALLALADPVLAADATETATTAAAAASTYDPNSKTWPAFFGRLHLVVLHLPIGLLIGAFVIEFFGLFRRSKGYDVAAAWLFVLGFFASVLAVVSGLLLATEKAAEDKVAGQDLNMFTVLFADADKGVSDTLGLHMWLGVALMFVAGVAALLKVIAVKRQWPDDVAVPDRGGLPLGLARLALIAIMVLIPLAGHLGGNLVHGRDYLTARAPSETVRSLIEAMNLDGASTTGEDPKPGGVGATVVPAKADWDKIIQPALDKHCIACHGKDKQNGDLRLDTLEHAIKGGSTGGTITPGDAEFSEMYRRVILPPSHDEFMPTNTKKYGMLSLDEIHALGEWITQFDGKLDAPPSPGNGKQAKDDTDTTPAPVKPLIDPAAIRAIEDAGGSAQSLSQEEDPDLLDVKFAYLKTLNPEAVAKIGNTAGQVAWLDLQGSAFGDEAAQQLPAMPKLTKLNLKDTAITDAGVAALPDLPSMEWLNLFGTGITDNALDALRRYTSLNKLYVTGTAVTAEGVAKLREALPNTEVYSDFDAEFNITKDLPEQDTPSAEPINTVCPVSGAAVKDGFASVFKGQTIGFCCNDCKGKFDAEPDKFADKIAPSDPESLEPVNEKCIVSGAELDPEQYVIYKGQKVGFCCEKCKAKFAAEPAKFAGKLP